MLRHLNIQNLILIDSLDLTFDNGLCVLTGETGAGKSILLDALGCVLGARTNIGIIKDNSLPTSVTAGFEISPEHPVQKVISEHGITLDGKNLLLKRIINKSGKSRSFINDQPVTVAFLRHVGEKLIEIESQSGNIGILNPTTHMDILDKFGNYKETLLIASKKYKDWQKKSAKLQTTLTELDSAKNNEEFLHHVTSELEVLDPQNGEEEKLDAERLRLRHGHKVIEELKKASSELSGERGIISKLQTAIKSMERIANMTPDTANACLAPLNQSLFEAIEAEDQLSLWLQKIDLNPESLEKVEERLFALRATARKHNVSPDELQKLYYDLSTQLENIKKGKVTINSLKKEEETSRGVYNNAAESLSKKRIIAAKKLDSAIKSELPSLKLGKALFKTVIETVKDGLPHINGIDSIRFKIKTNTSSHFGPLDQIASGGERSRFLLALKVCLADNGDMRSLIFDEIDNGVGGAVADAIGKRLAELSNSQQVIVVTHSPQVAARAKQHFVVTKADENGSTETTVDLVEDKDRQEEIARMLSGASVTKEARAAAKSLINGALK